MHRDRHLAPINGNAALLRRAGRSVAGSHDADRAGDALDGPARRNRNAYAAQLPDGFVEAPHHEQNRTVGQDN